MTSNLGKYETARRELESLGIKLILVDDMDVPEIQSIHLNMIAEDKAIEAYKKLGKPLMVNDSGFYLDAWENFPGTMTKHSVKTIGNKGILKLLKNEKRGASFRNTVAYIDQDHSRPVLFPSEIPGDVSSSPKGDAFGWSKLNRVFVPYDHDRTLAEINGTTDGLERYQDWRIKNYPIFRTVGEHLLEINKI